MVRTTFPRDLARILSARQHHRHGRVRIGRSVDPCHNALLPPLVAGNFSGRVSRQSDQPPAPRRSILQVSLSRFGGYWRTFVGASHHGPPLNYPEFARLTLVVPHSA